MPVVLQVLPRLITGGVERSTVEINQALCDAGWTALVASEGGPLVAEIERAGGRHVSVAAESQGPGFAVAQCRFADRADSRVLRSIWFTPARAHRPGPPGSLCAAPDATS